MSQTDSLTDAPEWGVNAFILQTSSDEPLDSSTALGRLTPHIQPVENGPGAIHGFFYQECETAGFTLRGSVFSSVPQLVERLKGHVDGEGPIALILMLTGSWEFHGAMTFLKWLQQYASTLPAHANPRVFIFTHKQTDARILTALEQQGSVYGKILFEDEGTCNFEGTETLLSGWEAPPPPPAPELSEKELLCVEARASLAEFRKANSIADDITLSGWIPDADEGAKLLFHQTSNGVAPMDLFGTAAMFFAMEDMGQVSPEEFNFTAPDALTASVSIRTSQSGKLIGLLLMVGKGGSRIPAEPSLAVAKAVADAFKAP